MNEGCLVVRETVCVGKDDGCLFFKETVCGSCLLVNV